MYDVYGVCVFEPCNVCAPGVFHNDWFLVLFSADQKKTAIPNILKKKRTHAEIISTARCTDCDTYFTMQTTNYNFWVGRSLTIMLNTRVQYTCVWEFVS